jgi:hypothetical protein
MRLINIGNSIRKEGTNNKMKKLYTLIGEIHDPGDEDYCLRLNENGYVFNILITDRKHIISLNINLKTCDIRTARKKRDNMYKALYGKEFTL